MSAETSSPTNLDVMPLPEAEGLPPLISTRQLFPQHKVLRIEHQGQFYLLRITRENKLILTK